MVAESPNWKLSGLKVETQNWQSVTLHYAQREPQGIPDLELGAGARVRVTTLLKDKEAMVPQGLPLTTSWKGILD